MLILAAVILIAAVMILSPISVVPDPVKVSYPYERNINCIEFSSDSKFIAVGILNHIFVYGILGMERISMTLKELWIMKDS